MGANRLPMRKLREILRLKYERRMRHRAIARACGVGVGIVSEYVGRARRAGLSWPLPAEWDDGILKARLFAAGPNAGAALTRRGTDPRGPQTVGRDAAPAVGGVS